MCYMLYTYLLALQGLPIKHKPCKVKGKPTILSFALIRKPLSQRKTPIVGVGLKGLQLKVKHMYTIRITKGYVQSYNYRTYNGYASWGNNFYAFYKRASLATRLKVLRYSGYTMAYCNG
jgi:hypothetical protein